MVIVGEYSDEGKSGKSVEGRPSFQQMFQDIETGKDSIDTQELDREHEGLQEKLKQVTRAKNKLASQMDNLSVSDKHYDKKYEDMQVRLDKFYDEVNIYEEEQSDGRILKSLKFRFPVFFNGQDKNDNTLI